MVRSTCTNVVGRRKASLGCYLYEYENFVFCRAMELPELQPRHICADYLEGLIHVVPSYGAGDDAGKYCIGGFTIDLYAGLLQERQQQYHRFCWRSVFLPRYDKVSPVHMHCFRIQALVSMSPVTDSALPQATLQRTNVVSNAMWGTMQRHLHPHLRYVSDGTRSASFILLSML